MDNNGKNKAASFIPVKETRTHNSIRKIKVSEEEETDDIMKIVKNTGGKAHRTCR